MQTATDYPAIIFKQPEQKHREKHRVQCQECGHRFHSALRTFDIRCPKCKGSDIDLWYGDRAGR